MLGTATNYIGEQIVEAKSKICHEFLLLLGHLTGGRPNCMLLLI